MASAELFLSDKGWFPRSEAIIWVSYLIVANTCDLAVERKAHVFSICAFDFLTGTYANHSWAHGKSLYFW